MSPKKKVVPYRTGYKLEARYPKKGILLIPLHGAGPRCRVDFDPHDDGPWATVQIMRIDDKVEEYTCAIPCHYAVPLILINKRLAFFEAQSAPDGTPLPLENGGRGATRLRLRELKEYTYLWRLRCRFLQAVFDMNHERQLDEAWRCDTIHGYVHRAYRRYGHDVYQRHTYWKDEIEAGRMPYSTPDIADMSTCSNILGEFATLRSTRLQDWGAFIAEEMTASTRLNAFLWNRISQGYSRLVRDDPPVVRWQAWRRGGTSRDLSASLFCTPPPPSAPFPTPERGWMSVEPSSATDEQEQEPYGAAVAASNNVAAQENVAVVQNSCSATLYDVNNDTECGSVIAATFDCSRVSAMPSSQGADQVVASTGGTGGLSHRRISRLLRLDDVPQGMALTDLLCTLSHVDDDRKPTLRVNYTSIS